MHSILQFSPDPSKTENTHLSPTKEKHIPFSHQPNTNSQAPDRTDFPPLPYDKD